MGRLAFKSFTLLIDKTCAPFMLYLYNFP